MSLANDLGDDVVQRDLSGSKLFIVVDCFDGEVDLDDLWVGKLKDEGGAPRLGRTTPDLLDLTLSSSPRPAGTPARLSLDPTVSTFAQPCSRGQAELWVLRQRQSSPGECNTRALRIGVKTLRYGPMLI